MERESEKLSLLPWKRNRQIREAAQRAIEATQSVGESLDKLEQKVGEYGDSTQKNLDALRAAEEPRTSYGVSAESWRGVDDESARKRLAEAARNNPEIELSVLASHYGLDQEDVDAMLSDWRAVNEDLGEDFGW